MRVLTVFLTLLALGAQSFAYQSSAATKKKASSKKSTRSKSTTAKSTPKSTPKTTTTARSRTSKKPITPAYRRSSQQQPSVERYKEIQQALASKGYFSGPVDGTWGPSSVDALKRFQREQNLTDDGKIGSLSLLALGLGPKRLARAEPPPQP